MYEGNRLSCKSDIGVCVDSYVYTQEVLIAILFHKSCVCTLGYKIHMTEGGLALDVKC